MNFKRIGQNNSYSKLMSSAALVIQILVTK